MSIIMVDINFLSYTPTHTHTHTHTVNSFVFSYIFHKTNWRKVEAELPEIVG